MIARALIAVLIALLCGAWEPVKPWPIEDTYTARTIVTGKDERNRPLGFRLCFEDVLVKASGDYRILENKRAHALAVHAHRYITEFSYRDRLEDKPLGDEQGTYDRPHYLTCKFDPKKIDTALRKLHRKPWTGKRPKLVMVIDVDGLKKKGTLTSDGPLDPDMRESLDAAAIRYGMTVVLPSEDALYQMRNLKKLGESEFVVENRLAAASGADIVVSGKLDFVEAELGWVARWSFMGGGTFANWTVKGVNYDGAFRNAIQGVMLALSGNGKPPMLSSPSACATPATPPPRSARTRPHGTAPDARRVACWQ
jgi:hypothetical protein